MKSSRLRSWFLLAVVGIIMPGCAARTVPIEVSPEGMARPPKVTKLPVSVGVYYSPALLEYQMIMKPGLIPFGVRAGRASVALFDQVLPAAFEYVVAVSGRPPLVQEGVSLVAVLEPTIETLDLKVLPVPVFSHAAVYAEIVYRFTLYSAEGAAVASWTVKGAGHGGRPGWQVLNRKPLQDLFHAVDGAVHRAMHDAVTRMLTESREVPAVRAWLRELQTTSVTR